MPRKRPATRVLVIDDDEMSRELLEVLLAGEGYEVATADSGEAALGYLEKAAKLPDVVLSDVQLPGVSGPELAAGLRKACGSGTMQVAMSGSQPPGETISSFDSFLLKPFTMQDVATVIRAGKPAGDAATSHAQSASDPVMRSPAQVTETRVKLADGAGSLPVLDEGIFQTLVGRMLPSQLQEMYKLCVDDARSRVAAMRRLLAEEDGEEFVREAHAIKGGAGMLGATELHRLAAALEVNGIAGNLRAPRRDVNSLDELSAACDRLERMLGSRL